MSILHRVREKSVVSRPSLLSIDRSVHVDGFEQALTSIVNINALCLLDNTMIVNDFERVTQMAERIDNLPAHMVSKMKGILEQRRCIILAIVLVTPPSNKALMRILQNGYLNTIKKWLDHILSGSVGGVDLLIHLLASLKNLPVTKSHVKNSGMGKAIGLLEKHRICVGSPSEVTIMDNLQSVKGAWNKSVKARKENKQKNSKSKSSSKRQLGQTADNPSLKKPKVDDSNNDKKNGKSFSSLLKKVSTSSPDRLKNLQDRKSAKKALPPPPPPPSLAMGQEYQQQQQQLQEAKEGEKGEDIKVKAKTNKSGARVKWSDHFGGNLTAIRVMGTSDEITLKVDNSQTAGGGISWSDRKQREQLHNKAKKGTLTDESNDIGMQKKEMFSKARKAKLVDEDEDDIGMIEISKVLEPTKTWKQPTLLPDNPSITKAQLQCKEIAVQIDRISKVTKVQYMSDYDVPPSPAPLSDVEQTLDMASHVSCVVGIIPFFIAQQETLATTAVISSLDTTIPASTAVATAPLPTSFYNPTTTSALGSPSYHSTAPPTSPSPAVALHLAEAATAEIVLSLGLPMFLVGHSVQALKTLVSSPGLLSTLIQANGQYDEPGLMRLVQQLTPNTAKQGAHGYNQQQNASTAYGSSAQQSSNIGIYGPASTSTSSYGQQASSSNFQSNYGAGGSSSNSARSGNGYRGDQNHSDTNLFLSGYGPTTTQAEILALFSPYVHVDEVVAKGTFSFVNTSDPTGAKNAREALNSTLLGGMPVRVNFAQRKARDPTKNKIQNGNNRGGNDSSNHSSPPAFANPSSIRPINGGSIASANAGATAAPGTSTGPSIGITIGINGQMIIDENAVRDDRGNPATKNLFVAGYGSGTTEQEIRDIFALHAIITGVVMKGTFSFVNTADRLSAIRSREALGGVVLNGGLLRINFAKETGRLGTSFDLTYGPGVAPPPGVVLASSGAANPPPPIPSHYGRSY